LIVELDPGEPISGRVQAEGQMLMQFAGWMELVALLEGTRSISSDTEGDATGTDADA
jgi:hypothetical protein